MKVTPVTSGSNSVASAAGAALRAIQLQTVAPAGDEKTAAPSTNETVPAAPDATKPLDPQLAALAKARRAIQVKDRELAELKQKLSGQPAGGIDPELLRTQPLRVLLDNGVTYDQLTQAVLANGGSREVQELHQKLRALEANVDKKLTDATAQQEQQLLGEMKREVEALVKDGDTYELVRAASAVPDVMQLIERTYRETGEVMAVPDALKMVEEFLIEEGLKIASAGKVRAKLQAPSPTQRQDPGMRTLTNRDGSQAPMSRRSRALAAFHGTLQR